MQTGSSNLLESTIQTLLGRLRDSHHTHQSKQSAAWQELKPGLCTGQDRNQSPSVVLPVTLWGATLVYKSQHAPITIHSARTRRWKQTQRTDSCSIHANEPCMVKCGKSELPIVALVSTQLPEQVRHVMTFSGDTILNISFHSNSQLSPATEAANLIRHFTMCLSGIESHTGT